MNYIKGPLRVNYNNSVLAFCDNASAISGYSQEILVPENFTGPSRVIRKTREYDICFNAETHNFPTSVAPFPGAATGNWGSYP